jgi:hypothetical protein
MYTIKKPLGSILRDALFQRRKPETLRELDDWILRDLGLNRSREANSRAVAEHGRASPQIVKLRAFYGF